jgi:FkbM family methyltransferase
MGLFDLVGLIINQPLNRDEKFKSLARAIRWQIGSRIVSRTVVHNWVNGSKFFVRTGETGLTGNIYSGLHEFSDMAYLLHILRAGELFVDVGANVGSYTILAGSVCGARGFAFEPVPETFKKLIDNVRLNVLEGKVICMNFGLGNENGHIKFSNSLGTMNHVLIEGEERISDFILVRLVKLDEVIEDEFPVLMKIDVEGFEASVLNGASKTLGKKSLNSVIVEMNGSGNRYGFDESDILGLMKDHLFKPFSYDPFTRTLRNLNGRKAESGNTLFIRDEEMAKARLRDAPKFSVLGRSI